MSQQWMYRAFQQEFGPFSFDQLIEMAKTGTITADDEVKMGPDGKWRRAGSIGRLVAVLPFAAPASPTSNVKPPQSTTSSPIGEAPRSSKPKSAPVIATIPAAAAPSSPSARPRSNTVVAAVDSPVVPVPTPKAKSAPSIVAIAANSTAEKQITPVPQKFNPVVTAVELQVAPPVKSKTKSSPSIPVPASDVEILARAREALNSRNLPNLVRVELEVSDGVVVARGALQSEGERLLAIRVLQQTTGVVKVVDAFELTQTKATPRSQPVIKSMPAAKASRSSGPGAMSQLIENMKGEYRNHAIALVAASALLGFWFFPGGPYRPVAVHPVKGKISLDGQPLANAAIVLHHVGASKLPSNLHPRAKATADGSFVLETFDAADGAPDGEFVATVFLTEESEVDGEKMSGPNMLPAVYSRPETSPFKIRITSATKELQPLELTKG